MSYYAKLVLDSESTLVLNSVDDVPYYLDDYAVEMEELDMDSIGTPWGVLVAGPKMIDARTTPPTPAPEMAAC